MSYFSPSLARNIVWETPYVDFGPNPVLAASEKYLKVESSELVWKTKNAPLGPVELNSDGLIDGSLLPSFVNDVLSYATSAGFPTIGEQGIIYLANDTGYTYRWTGTAYYNISTQGFYTRGDLDGFFALKANLSGALFTGNIDLSLNNITNVGNVYTFKLSASQISDASDNIHMHLGSNTIFLDKPLNANGNNITGAALISSTSFSGTSMSATTGTFGNIYPSSTVDTLLAAKLSKSGGTMTGSILMGLNDLGGAANVYTVNLSTTNISDGANVLHAHLSGNTIILDKPIVCGTQSITGTNTISASNVNCTSLGATSFYNLGGVQHFVLSGTSLTMIPGINLNMNTSAISGCSTITATTAQLTNLLSGTGETVIMCGQRLLSIPNLQGLTGQYVLSVVLPSYVTSSHYINNINVYITDDNGATFESVSEYGWVNGIVGPWWYSRYVVATNTLTITFFDIALFGHQFDSFGAIYARVSFNVI